MILASCVSHLLNVTKFGTTNCMDVKTPMDVTRRGVHASVGGDLYILLLNFVNLEDSIIIDQWTKRIVFLTNINLFLNSILPI